MKFKLTTFSTKHILIWMLSSMISLLAISFFLAVQYNIDKIFFLLLVFTSILCSYFLALSQSKKTTSIVLDKKYFQFEQVRIDWAKIEGFYINSEGIGMTEIKIRSNDQSTFSIASITYGTAGKYFRDFLREFENIVRSENHNIRVLTHFDFRPKEQKPYKTFIIVSAIILVVFNLAYVFFSILTDMPFNWKILLVNLSFIPVYGFYKRNKK